jgi:putative ABC transport system permease protein
MISRLDGIWQEVRYGRRLLVRNRSFTVIVGLTLALGVGATSAIFSVLYATVLAPLPFPESEKLVMIRLANKQGRQRGFTSDIAENWSKNSKTLDSAAIGMLGQVPFTVTGPEGAQRVVLEQVDFRTLEVLGTKPILGRWFQPDEVLVQGNTAQTIVISYGLWQRVFGGDLNVIGKKLPGWSAGWGETVIGVMPKGFYTRPDAANTDAWYVIAKNPGLAIGRIRPEVLPQQVQAELATMLPESFTRAAQQPENTFHLEVVPLQEATRGGYASRVYLLMAAVGFVLMIAIVNVANLQLNRGVRRQSEMATRVALGAGRWRLFRQLILENVILSLVGGALGVFVAMFGITLFVYLAPNFYLPSQEITINGPVLAFVLTVCIAAGILAGLVPGFRASNPNLSASLKQGGRSVSGRVRLGLRRGLVVAEIALAVVLLVGAGLMINSYARLTSVDVGMNPDNVLTMEVNLAGMDRYRTRHATNHYSVTPAVSELYTKAMERLAFLPGVESVASTSNLPPRYSPTMPFLIVGKTDNFERNDPNRPQTQYHEVSAGYFQTMRIPLLRGRPFDNKDSENGPGVVIISESLAHQYFGDEDPIGQSVVVHVNEQNPALDSDRQRQIVGIVGDIRMELQQQFLPIMYVPYQQSLKEYAGFAPFFVHAQRGFVLRTSGSPEKLASEVRRAFSDVDPNVALTSIMPMRQRLTTGAGISRGALEQQYWMRLLGIFATLGIFLAAIGVYGVIAYAVEQRSHEFGIRATFGASNSDILRLVLREGIIVTIVGLAIGVAGAFGLTRFISGQLYGVKPMDPITIASAAVVLIVIALCACYIPARRATKLDPVTVLRAE